MSSGPFFGRLQIFVTNCMLYQMFSHLSHVLPSATGSELQGTVEEVENLRKEVDKLKHSGETDFCVDSSGSHVNTHACQAHLKLSGHFFLYFCIVFLLKSNLFLYEDVQSAFLTRHSARQAIHQHDCSVMCSDLFSVVLRKSIMMYHVQYLNWMLNEILKCFCMNPQ